MPWTFEGKLNRLENKTLRYKGHWEQMKSFRELGLFDEKKINFKNSKFSAREFYHFLLEPKLGYNDRNDICLMRVDGSGIKDNAKCGIRYEVHEKYDNHTKFMAMDARHCAGREMHELMAYGASVGSNKAKVENNARGFKGSSCRYTSKFFDKKDGIGTMPHSLIGYAGDGFEIHYLGSEVISGYKLRTGNRPSGPGGLYDGTYNEDYAYAPDQGVLDECNGGDLNGKFVYFLTNFYPFVGRCLWGKIAPDFGTNRH